MSILDKPAPEAAEALIGKLLVRRFGDGSEAAFRITETEAYYGESDTACHARFGRTKRSEVLYRPAGTVYVYLCYGIHWMLNVITGDIDDPQGVLIRACVEAEGPGKLTKRLGIAGERNRDNAVTSENIWIGDDGYRCEVVTDKRVGIGYASREDQDKLWRFKTVK